LGSSLGNSLAAELVLQGVSGALEIWLGGILMVY